MPHTLKSCAIGLLVFLYPFAGKGQSRDAYSSLVYNGKEFNHLIVDRFPVYGMGTENGCVVRGPISLKLQDIGSTEVEGWITDSRTGEPLPAAMIRLEMVDGSKDARAADSLGRFRFVKSSGIRVLRIDYLGYHSMVIKKLSRKLF
jgi:hypothetical protein